MVLGQLVAISVAIALFLTAVFMHTKRPMKPKAPFSFWILLLAALATEAVMPVYAGTKAFMPALGMIHLAVLIPLFFVPTDATGEKRTFAAVGFKKLTFLLALVAVGVHYGTTLRVLHGLPTGITAGDVLFGVVTSHPAQGSVSLDVVWVFIITGLLFLLTGSTPAMILKFGLLGAAVAVAAARRLGVNWLLIASCVPIVLLLAVGLAAYWLTRVRARNAVHREAILSRLGVQEEGVIPGTTKEAPKIARRRLVVGFWHPYW